MVGKGGMTPEQANHIRMMEQAGQLAARVLQHVGGHVRPGISTNELDRIAHDNTLSRGALPAPLNYKGFPKSICTSVNECICHGVPNDKPLQEGDIVNIDVTCIKNGFHGDTSAMFFVGKVSDTARRLCHVAREARDVGIQQVKAQVHTGAIGFEVNKFVTRCGYYTVREIGGHGIGRKFHEDPFIPSFGKKHKGPRLKAWSCITVEPMINLTSPDVVGHDIPGSQITVFETVDKSLSAQWEHTLLVTDTGHQILTLD